MNTVTINDEERVLILGRRGQLGSALGQLIKTENLFLYDKNDCDLTDTDQIKSSLDKIKPTLIFNAAAYTQVDLAETEIDLNWAINAKAPETIAKWCKKNQSLLVHYSTDYVYSGDGQSPWNETDPTQPMNEYGKAKRAGEIALLESGCHFINFRTSWVYNSTHPNFFTTMLRLAKEKESLSIVSDQFGSPTYAPFLAQASAMAVNVWRKNPTPQTFNLCNLGETNWYEFAQEIFSLVKSAGVELKIKSTHPIPSSEYPTPATRPLNSRMNLKRFTETFDIPIPHWKDGLKDCVKRYTE